jgi:hypothetical protein
MALKTIPFYKEINEFLASIPSSYSTQDPNFYCLRLKENEVSINNYKPPFRKDFYFIALVTNAGETKIIYEVTGLDEKQVMIISYILNLPMGGRSSCGRLSRH